MKLNLGCGFNKVKDHINVDKYPHASPDLLIDLEQTPWPLASDTATHVLLNHCLEHLGRDTDVFLNIIRELYRVCQDGATVQINVPHPRHDNFINDPTHVRIITPALLQLFSKEKCIDWVARNASNSPLALYLNVDFDLLDAITRLEPEYDERLHSNALSEAAIHDLLRHQNNIATEFQITLKAIKSAEKTRGYCEKLFTRGLSLYEAHQDEKASQLCQHVLQLDPGHFESLHLCGLIAHRRGDLEAACRLIASATAINPNNPVAQYNAGIFFQQKGHLDTALASFGIAISLKPDYAAAHSRMGLTLADLNRPEEGLDHCIRATELAPNDAEAYEACGKILHALKVYPMAAECFAKARHLGLDDADLDLWQGRIACENGQPEAALAHCNQAILKSPGCAGAYECRGMALEALCRPRGAIKNYAKALSLAPETAHLHRRLAETWTRLGLHELAEKCTLSAAEAKAQENAKLLQLGNRLKDERQFESAIQHYRQLIEQDTSNLSARYHLAQCFYELKQAEIARSLYDQIIESEPDSPEAYFNRGVILHEAQDQPAAIDSYRQAIRLRANYSEAHYNCGNALKELNRLDEAIAEYDLAIRQQPEYASAHLNRALTLLLKGDYRQGWKEYEWRWQTSGLAAHKRNFVQPLWLGKSPIAGRTILLHGEQGLGDTLQFCRYAQDIQKLGARVILEVPGTLIPILSGLPGVDTLLATGTPLPDFDVHCPLLSLPLALDLRLDQMPSPSAYLRASGEKLARWESRLGPRNKPRIGLAWRGSRVNTNDANRSMELHQLLPALIPECDYYCLQKDYSQSDLAQLQDAPNLQTFQEELEDFSDTAALCELMDAVVCVDTSVAHLAGAMGRPVWLMLPFCPDWRWLLQREDSVWYPQIRTLRQQQRGDWSSVVSAVRSALTQLPG